MSRYKSNAYGQDPGGSSSVGPLVIHRSSSESEETTPLLLGKPHRAISRDGCKLIAYSVLALLALVVIVNLSLHFFYCPLYPSTMKAIRHSWEKEVAQHDLFLEEWRLEEQEHATLEKEWKLQKEWHEKEVAHRILEEDRRQERVRQAWAEELNMHAREAEEYAKKIAERIREEQERQERVRKGWDLEVKRYEELVKRRMLEEEERQARARKEWEEEVERHRHAYEEMNRREKQRQENERAKWRREVEDRDRIEEERRRREEEERQKLNMFWGGINAHTCTTYATRKYTAQLMNLPTTWEHRVEACKVTPLEVHGMSYLPKTCEDKGPGVVIGTWEIDRHEPDCAAFWTWYKDKGCTSPGSGKRRIEEYLENLPKGGDWREFCATTPVHFLGFEFTGAQECFQHDGGTYGHWEIDDVKCWSE